MKLRNSQLILLAIVLFSLALRIPALFFPHIENDEVIYQTLADKVVQNPLDYTLRGTQILKNLPKINYDQPLFHRPPFFVYLLALTRKLLGIQWSVILPILAGVFAIVATYGVAKELYDERTAVISALIFACCPVLFFASTRILIDSLLVFLLTLTVWVFLVALRKENVLLFVLAGVFFGLAILTKEPAIMLVLPCLYFLFRQGFSTEKYIYLFIFLAAALLTVSPWYIHFYRTFGTIFPWWAKLYPENLEMFPFVRMVVDRPWYFYLQNLSLVMPIYLFAGLSLVVNLKKKQMLGEAIWFFSFWVPITLYGIMGQGYQTRYILPAIPALVIISAGYLSQKSKVIWALGILLLSVGLLTGIMNSLIFVRAEVFALFSYF